MYYIDCTVNKYYVGHRLCVYMCCVYNPPVYIKLVLHKISFNGTLLHKS